MGVLNEPVEGGDWAGCARALLDHGMPGTIAIAGDPEHERIARVQGSSPTTSPRNC